MKKYWFSFSFEGINTGVCIVQANNHREALQKTIDLKIHPKHDDILCFECDSLEDDSELSLNRLYFREEMIELGYGVTQQIKKK